MKMSITFNTDRCVLTFIILFKEQRQCASLYTGVQI